LYEGGTDDKSAKISVDKPSCKEMLFDELTIRYDGVL
jgi:hypothetical protein